jgi:hypothetical protein
MRVEWQQESRCVELEQKPRKEHDVTSNVATPKIQEMRSVKCHNIEIQRNQTYCYHDDNRNHYRRNKLSYSQPS